MKKILFLLLVLFVAISPSFSAIQRSYSESNKGQNGFMNVIHDHEDFVMCVIKCWDSGNSQCPNCSQSIISSGSNNDLSLHNYAKNQILLGNLTGNQVSSDGLWKVKWEKKQNQDVSIVAWPLSGTEPPLW